jgi:hypothetical protein
MKQSTGKGYPLALAFCWTMAQSGLGVELHSPWFTTVLLVSAVWSGLGLETWMTTHPLKTMATRERLLLGLGLLGLAVVFAFTKYVLPLPLAIAWGNLLPLWVPFMLIMAGLQGLCRRVRVFLLLQIVLCWGLMLAPLWVATENSQSPRWLVDALRMEGLDVEGVLRVFAIMAAILAGFVLFSASMPRKRKRKGLIVPMTILAMISLGWILFRFPPPTPAAPPPPQEDPPLFAPPPSPPEPTKLFLARYLHTQIPPPRLSAYFFRGRLLSDLPADVEVDTPGNLQTFHDELSTVLDESLGQIHEAVAMAKLYQVELIFLTIDCTPVFPEGIRAYELLEPSERYPVRILAGYRALDEFSDLDLSFATEASFLPPGLSQPQIDALLVLPQGVVPQAWKAPAELPLQEGKVEQVKQFLNWAEEAWVFDRDKELQSLESFDVLLKGGAGNDAAFARATLLGLRAIGVPARMVSGYRIDLPRGTARDEILVTIAHATVWTELYWEDAGWMPILHPQQRRPVEEEEPEHDEVQEERNQSLQTLPEKNPQPIWPWKLWLSRSVLGLLGVLLILRLRNICGAYGFCLLPGWEERQFHRASQLVASAGWLRMYGESRMDFVARVEKADPKIGRCFSTITRRYLESLNRDPARTRPWWPGLRDLLRFERLMLPRLFLKGWSLRAPETEPVQPSILPSTPETP